MRARSSIPSSTPFIDALGHGAGDKRIEILRGVAATGSISQSAREAGVSYKAAWQAIDTLTNLAGVALVQRAVGGAGGGGALLTAQGMRLLALSEALDAARREVHARWSSAGDGFGDAGDAASEPTGAGRGDFEAARAGAAGATLSRLALRTSMRNQLPATVERLELTGRVARVVMRLDARPRPGRPSARTDPVAADADADAAADRIAARITRESAELLGLRPGLPVIALCKAMAVRIARPAADPVRESGARAALDHLDGTVAGATRGEGGDELAVALAGGLRLIGFAAGGTGLRTRQRVRASIDESAWVVALAG